MSLLFNYILLVVLGISLVSAFFLGFKAIKLI